MGRDLGVKEDRLSALIAHAREHETDLPPIRHTPAGKADYLRARLGPHADVEMVGPFTPKGKVNGLILRGPEVVAEFGDTTFVDEIASATKSFLSTLAGIAFDRGLLKDVHRSVFADTGLELLDSPRHRRITWQHLLHQTSEWQGELFGKIPTGHAGVRVGKKPKEPGDWFEYNDVRVNLLSRCLLELFRRPLPEVLRETVMDPIGASDSWQWHGYSTARVTIDGREIESVSGGAHWGGGIWMSSRDLALYGRLYLQDGVWNGRRLLSSEWIAGTRAASPRNPMYGYLWWLQHDEEGNQVSFAAQGGGSHHCFVIPDHDLVVVLRWIEDEAWQPFLDRALALVKDRPPLGPVRYLFDRVNPA